MDIDDLKYVLSTLEYGLADCEDVDGSAEKHYNSFANAIDIVKKQIEEIKK